MDRTDAESTAGVPRTRKWVLASFIASYGLLLPGLSCTLISCDLSALSGELPLKNMTESMLQFVHELHKRGAHLGFFLLILSAMVIPAAKLVLLILSEFWRRGGSAQVMRARFCVFALQAMSKWACEGVFAYVLLFNLLRGLDHPPLLQAKASQGIGFTCFAIFCMVSAISALGLKVPPLPKGMEHPTNKDTLFAQRPALLAAAVATMCAVFVPLLVMGIMTPSMSLSVSVGSFFKPSGPLDPALRQIVEMLHIEELTHSEVSFQACMTNLAKWMIEEPRANSLLSLTLFAVFVILTTVLNMVMLMATSVLLWRRAAEPPRRKLEWLMKVSTTLKKLGFLDVAIVGLALVVACGGAYRKLGIELHLNAGLLLLFGAELCHYGAYMLVKQSVQAVTGEPEESNEARQVEDKRADEVQGGVEDMVDLESAKKASVDEIVDLQDAKEACGASTDSFDEDAQVAVITKVGETVVVAIAV